MYVCMYVRMYVCMYVCMYVRVCVCVCVYRWGLFVSRLLDSLLYVPLMLGCIKAMDRDFLDTDVALPNRRCMRVSMMLFAVFFVVVAFVTTYRQEREREREMYYYFKASYTLAFSAFLYRHELDHSLL